MSEVLKTVSPVDGSVYVERPLASAAEIDVALDKARDAQKAWRAVPIEQRQEILRKAVSAFIAKKDEIAAEISWQMGRPISQAGGEVGGFEERATYMIDVAPEALGDFNPGEKAGFNRFIRREALGVVAIIAPWNFPYLTAVNGVIPALMAGNAVVLKHSHQTPLCAERFAEAFVAAGLPAGVFQRLHLSHADAEKLMGDRRVDFVNFTGSVPGGHAVQRAVASKFIATGLELGGKDPAYIRADVNLAHAVENVIDGAFFNSGQSCCGIERIYVHESQYDAFVEQAAALVGQYRLGSPIDPETNLGPMVRASSAEFVRGQIADAIASGATALIDPAQFAANAEGTPYLAPQILINVDHSMRVMSEESFGPVVGIMKVSSDEEAIRLMNDSEFGLTASIWTSDEEAALAIGDQLETGTVFMNRADYLDPALAWVGVKNSGRGCTLSKIGYESLTRPKSFHLRTKI
ncbi:aldehyde dehydrogenase family protein [Thalassospira sp. TSL5-1]|uniref:aldehyde dehydrogenase family protein n=1 Tax=Thalassospira sp. TSL5-1 TaxID=1544451 RepID=UPI00093AB830|nr:aldehyde dehydrogenase family protein [Thalassospira sp. TSL5-1]OKH89796.1 aldehyde dehydrogenase [Thalassospira sp. TSL5-1]